MGFYVHIHVCFACDNNDGVAELAKKYLSEVKNKEAQWFLKDLAGRSGDNPGPKGGLSLWGIIGNYTDVNDFVFKLHPFWKDLLTLDIEGGPCSHEHILVFEETEQSERTTAFEIYLDDEEKELLIVSNECPFTFAQY
jgi:hypothetical protein